MSMMSLATLHIMHQTVKKEKKRKKINIIASQSMHVFRMEMKKLKVGMCELARFEV